MRMALEYSLLTTSIIARKEKKKEGRGREERQDTKDSRILNQKKVSSRVKRMKPGKCGFKLNQWK